MPQIVKSDVKNIELLDYIRAVAILTVMFDHSLTNVYGYESLPWLGWFRDFSAPISLVYFLPFNFGQMGVAIFFFVSGFCIHLSFQQQGRRWGCFFIRRIFRIYPAYLMALLFFTLFLIEQSHLSLHHLQVVTRYAFEIPSPPASCLFWRDFWTHLFLVHNVYLSDFTGITGAFWSLAVEAQLYVLYPVLVWLISKLGWRNVMIILASCELLIRGADGITRAMDATDTAGGIISGFFSRSPFGYWFSWALGAFMADAFMKRQLKTFRQTSLFRWIILAIVCNMIKPLYPFCFLLFALMTAIVAAKLLSGIRPEIKVPKFRLNPLGKIGLWSYSIYLVHQPLLIVFTGGISCIIPTEQHSILLGFLITLIVWLFIIAFSILCYNLFELPGIALGKKFIHNIDSHNAITLDSKSIPKSTNRNNTLVFSLMVFAFLFFVFGSLYLNGKLKPNPVDSNNLAWSLATNPQANNRNGTLAVKLAEEACNETQFKQTTMVGTLAAAYAETGQFD